MPRLRLVRDDAAATDETLFLAATPAFTVSDVERSADFFARVADFEPAYLDDGSALLRRGGVTLSLWQAGGAAGSSGVPWTGGSVSCAIEVSGVVALHHHCTDLGCVHPSGRLEETEWGTREFAILDPDGNLVTFWERRGR